MPTVKAIICFICCWLEFPQARGYHILAIYPQGFKSHFLFNTAILNKLSNAGHEVVIITPFDTSTTNENGKFQVSNSAHVSSQNRVTAASQLKSVGIRNRAFVTIETLYKWTNYENLLCYDVMESDEIHNAIAGRIRFDVIFAEMMAMQGCYLLLAHNLSIPIIGTLPTSPWVSELMLIGNPINPTYVPNAWSRTGNTMSLYERVKNTLFVAFFYLYEKLMGAIGEENFRRAHFPDTQWSDVQPPALLFLNSHPTLQPRPMAPNAIEIGGVHIGPARPLSKRLQTFINEAKYGVILFTFGTNNSTHVTDYKKEIFADVFATIPQRVIWKLDQPYKNVTKNVLVTNWVPQRDILSDKNVKAFISHCGAFGMQEAVHTATPVVGIPLHIDQIHNALVLEELGVAVHLDLRTLTRETLLNALNKVINDTRYRKNMKKLSAEFNDNPMTAAEKIIYWTEYVIRHKGTPHLKTMGSTLSFYQNLYIDVIFCLVILFSAIILAILCVSRTILAMLVTKNSNYRTKKIK